MFGAGTADSYARLSIICEKMFTQAVPALHYMFHHQQTWEAGGLVICVESFFLGQCGPWLVNHLHGSSSAVGVASLHHVSTEAGIHWLLLGESRHG